MGFSKMMDLLKEKEKGSIVIVKLGAFYIATEEDAVLLHKKLELKCTCFKMNVCKVGFPVNALEKYVEKLNETKYAYVIYDLDREKAELKELVRKRGKHNKEIEKNLNCIFCGNIDKRYEKADKYILAISKILQDNQNNKNE